MWLTGSLVALINQVKDVINCFFGCFDYQLKDVINCLLGCFRAKDVINCFVRCFGYQLKKNVINCLLGCSEHQGENCARLLRWLIRVKDDVVFDFVGSLVTNWNKTYLTTPTSCYHERRRSCLPAEQLKLLQQVLCWRFQKHEQSRMRWGLLCSSSSQPKNWVSPRALLP